MKIVKVEASCHSCLNMGQETMDRVAACNCCEDGEFYVPIDDAKQ